jgi:phage terminase large subunit
MSLILPQPHAKQAEFLADPHRYKVLNWGRRTGKSVGVWNKVMLEGMVRQGLYYIVCPTYKQAKSIYWRDICKKYSSNDFMEFNEQELSITFKHLKGIEIPTTSGLLKIDHNEEIPPTRIELKGADNPDSLRGTGLCGVVLDEYAFMPDGKYVKDVILRPQLADKDGWTVFISTPNGIFNDFYDLVQTAQTNDDDEWFYSHATALDNPHFPKGEFEKARKEYEKDGKVEAFNQEWMAEFTNPQSLVYKQFDTDVHIFSKMEDMPMTGTRCLSIDFGMTDPTAAVFVLIDLQGNWWVYDEIYETNLDLDPLVSALRNKMGDDHFTRILGDGAAKFEIESLRRRRFAITRAKKGNDSLQNGIKELRQLLAVREGTGKPKLFVKSTCKNLIREFMSYSFVRDAFDELTDTPEDKNNHALDALRYLALAKAQQGVRVKKKKTYDSSGRPVYR